MFGQPGRLWFNRNAGPLASIKPQRVAREYAGTGGDLAEDGPEIANWFKHRGRSVKVTACTWNPHYARCLLSVRSLPSKPKFLASRREKRFEHWRILVTIDLTLLRLGTVRVVVM